MIVHDEDTLQQALSLVEQGPVRYSDQHAFVIFSEPGQLEYSARRALERSDIAVVVPVGQERAMEVHAIERPKILARRKRQELKDVRAWIAAHPELKAARTEQEIVKLYRKERKESA